MRATGYEAEAQDTTNQAILAALAYKRYCREATTKVIGTSLPVTAADDAQPKPN